MNIEYIYPLSRAWHRMKQMLFHPFNINKWLGLGFTAFLATLFESSGGKGGNDSNKHGWGGWEEVREFPAVAWEWLQDNPVYATLIYIGILLLIAFIIFCTWLNSRGKFMFLDNVVHNRSHIVKPWNAFESAGNSLFAWRLVFGLIVTAAFAIFFILAFDSLHNIWMTYDSEELMILPAVILGLIFLVLIMIASTVSWLLNDFVVPVMYKNNCSTVKAWSTFLQLFFANVVYFLLYGLLLLLIQIVAVVVVLVVGFSTCCIGFFLLLAPYISSVVTLPYSVTLRAFSLEFLAQFGYEYKIFPEVEPTVMV